MGVSAGSRLGSYEILSLIGAGGMGEVYRARDTRLNRDVAIKVLPADRLIDERRRRRFVQEAQSASALNHPHIVTIHEIESAGELDFIVMEYVRGKSLDAVIPRGGMRLGELLRIAIPVADALAAAHSRGIVHRDLKPANVIVGGEGAVKVVDFGLAKLIGGEVTPDDETVTHFAGADLSALGTIAGTAPYMPPEQATGGKVDARSDIFSFGAMLYEMATGTRAFRGESSAEILAAVMQSQPKPPTELVASLPRELERVILRCLRKQPERRFQTMLDVKIELQEIKEESDSSAVGTVVAPVRAARPRVALVGTVVVGLMVAAAWVFWHPTTPAVAVPEVVPLTALTGLEFNPTFSPDAEQVAFEWNGENEDNFDIYLKPVGSSDARRLTTSPERDTSPAWSPDGRQIAFGRLGDEPPATIYLVSPVSGVERKLVDFPAVGHIGWSPDSQWLAIGRLPIAGDGGVYLISAQDGAIRPLTAAKAGRVHLDPAFSADGRSLAYSACGAASCDLEVLPLDASLQLAGALRRLLTGEKSIETPAWDASGRSLLYAKEPVPANVRLWRVDVNGRTAPERFDLAGLGARQPALRRNRLAFALTRNVVSIHPLDATLTSPAVLSSTFWDYHPVFSPSGDQLAFSSSRSGGAVQIWVSAADGSRARQLTHGPFDWQGSPSWSPDGRQIAFDSRHEDGSWSVWAIDADGGAPRQVTTDRGDEFMPSWSHDGQWIYYVSDQGRGREVWRVRAGGGGARQVTRGGSALVYPFESPDGREVFYKAANGEGPLLAVPLTGGPTREVLPCLTDTFVAVDQGIYYAECGKGPVRSLRFRDTITRADRVLGKLRDIPQSAWARPAVSPDAKTILVHRSSVTSDLMLIENFR